ncbi:metabotropic glutamate receptor 3-like protein [Dinothrombium tinctorium]|uniref:Metabotropic glutamate receptor 3-like protein n=1 Tax=Dinothrombium tinctorium TaxID=1965070 RepID=A0A443RRD9_9ACAR|nr:metabotropic glutamate receptor 3-like protein [Dinothrombium tinctorium]
MKKILFGLILTTATLGAIYMAYTLSKSKTTQPKSAEKAEKRGKKGQKRKAEVLCPQTAEKKPKKEIRCRIERKAPRRPKNIRNVGWEAKLPTIQMPCTVASKEVIVDGDVLLGGAFPITEGKHCDRINAHRGIQRMEAMLFALDKINQQQSNFKIGARIFNTCLNRKHALKQSLKLIENSLNEKTAKKLIGIVGASDSMITSDLATLFQLFDIPMISYASTSWRLADTERFPLFLRTFASDFEQLLVYIDLMNRFNWTYVSIVKDDSGELIFSSRFERLLSLSKKCLANIEYLPSESKEEHFDTILKRLTAKQNARVVFLFIHPKNTRMLLEAANRLEISDLFIWIMPFIIIEHPEYLKNLESFAENALSIQFQPSNVAEFNNYLENMTPESNKRNPWFKEFWQAHFNCSLSIKDAHHECSPKLRLNTENNFLQEPKVSSVINAVYAIYQYQNSSGVYAFHKIGSWSNDRLHLNETKIKWRESEIPRSICSEACSPGSRKIFSAGNDCCWVCAKCASNEFLVDEYTCKSCSPGYKPTTDQKGCEKDETKSVESQKSSNPHEIKRNSPKCECLNEFEHFKCRLAHLEHNLRPDKYAKPHCSLND